MIDRCPVIAIGGLSGAGKDTAARAISAAQGHLVRHAKAEGLRLAGVSTWSFAAPVKSMSYQAFQAYGLSSREWYEKHPEEKTHTLPALGRSAVDVWCHVGEAIREIHPHVWVDHALAFARPHVHLVLSDLRLPVEAYRVSELGGWCVRVDRPGAEARAMDSELGDWGHWDAVIENDGCLTGLAEQAVDVAVRYLREFARVGAI